MNANGKKTIPLVLMIRTYLQKTAENAPKDGAEEPLPAAVEAAKHFQQQANEDKDLRESINNLTSTVSAIDRSAYVYNALYH